MLEELNIGDCITIDNKASINFTGRDDFEIKHIENYETDEGELVTIYLGEYYLIYNLFSGLPKIYILELFDEVYSDLYFHKENFTKKIKIEGGNGEVIYRQSPTGQKYSEEQEAFFCEYSSKDFLNTILLKRTESGIDIFRGFEINEEDIVN